MKLSDYLLKFTESFLCSLIADDIANRIGRLLPILGEASSGQYIIECEMHRPDKAGDFSIQYTREEMPKLLSTMEGGRMHALRKESAVWARISEALKRWQENALFSQINDFWLEFDYEALAKDPPLPCCFFDADSLPLINAIDGPLTILLGEKPSPGLEENLSRCVSALEGVGLFQLGVMLSREENPRPVRLFTNDLRAEQVVPFLSKAGWGSREEYKKLESFLAWAMECSDGLFIIDFGVHENALTSKLGICFLPMPGLQPMEKLLNVLVGHGLALQEKCDSLLKWMIGNEMKNGNKTLVNDISHFKFPFEGDILGSKVYLRQHPLQVSAIMQNNRW